VLNAMAIFRNEAVSPAQRQSAERIVERQVQKMARLLDDLLDVSRIARGKVDLRKARVELAPLVQDAIETVRPAIEAKGHALRIQVPKEPLWLEADSMRISQILSNLLSNASKYTDPGGHIELVATREGGEVVIAVSDDGVGISPDFLPRLIERFVQGPSTLDRAEGGLGIGLSLVRAFVEQHGGTVGASSGGPGRGSKFVVRLPLAT
jgi:signal transduction histidine kinase